MPEDTKEVKKLQKQVEELKAELKKVDEALKGHVEIFNQHILSLHK